MSKLNIKTSTPKLTVSALMIAILIIFAQISLNIGPIPITLATLALYLIGGILKPTQAILCTSIYLIMGTVGLPVFSNFKGGYSVLLEPTGGYLLGYLLITICAVLFNDSVYKKIIGYILGTFLCYLCGTIWFMISTHSPLLYTLSICVFPFLIGDFLKIVLSVILTKKLKFIKKY